MMDHSKGAQQKYMLVTMESLMPEKHFLRDLDRLVDFSFIYEKAAPLYSHTGRPSVDPVVLVKMLLLGYLYGIDSERKLEQEIQVNIAYRWFLGIDLDERVPDHSTISQLRRRKFSGSAIFQEIFDEIVRKCMDAGLVSGKLLLTDSTHIRANARNDLREVIEVPDTPSEYMKKLDQEAYETGLIDAPVEYDEAKTKEIVKSVTDPESGLLNRPGKPNCFCYLDHQTTDADYGIITDVFVTAGNVSDNVPHSERIRYQIENFGFETEAVCADGGYASTEIFHDMQRRGICVYVPLGVLTGKRRSISGHYIYSTAFVYNVEKDVYVCPMDKELAYTGFARKRGYKRYRAQTSDCRSCPLRKQCIGTSAQGRLIERHLHEDAIQKQKEITGTPEYYAAMRLRKIWCEGNFSHQKERHNLKRTRKRGIEKVTEQCLLSACALNLKRLVKYLGRNSCRLTIPLLSLFLCWRTGFYYGWWHFVNSAETGTPYVNYERHPNETQGRRKTRLPCKKWMRTKS